MRVACSLMCVFGCGCAIGFHHVLCVLAALCYPCQMQPFVYISLALLPSRFQFSSICCCLFVFLFRIFFFYVTYTRLLGQFGLV